MSAEISFDLIMEGDMDFVKGTYRSPGSNWQVFIFSRRLIPRPEINASAKWASGVTGISILFPQSQRLDKLWLWEFWQTCWEGPNGRRSVVRIPCKFGRMPQIIHRYQHPNLGSGHKIKDNDMNQLVSETQPDSYGAGPLSPIFTFGE